MGRGSPLCHWRMANVPIPEAHLAAVLGALVLDYADGHSLVAQQPVRRIVGASMIALGIMLAGWAVVAAEQVDMARPGRLVPRGPYTISRNPMYVAWHVLYCGLLILTGSRWMLRLLPAVIVVTHFVIRREEQQLRRAFGDEFEHYCSLVRRYL
ncbi:MAG TPA: isoprenylcysteine carboxylmethyltransferase family protein [Chloroflexota bacterium]|nr:isoprenylcysteine carboxylmethyltransferase family protein [Chloroflexota bacterium]